MSQQQLFDRDPDVIDQLAGFTGFCWTASVLVYLATVLGFGGGLVPRFIVEPPLLLVLGCAFLIATIGLDELHRTRTDRNL